MYIYGFSFVSFGNTITLVLKKDVSETAKIVCPSLTLFFKEILQAVNFNGLKWISPFSCVSLYEYLLNNIVMYSNNVLVIWQIIPNKLITK